MADLLAESMVEHSVGEKVDATVGRWDHHLVVVKGWTMELILVALWEL